MPLQFNFNVAEAQREPKMYDFHESSTVAFRFGSVKVSALYWNKLVTLNKPP